MAEFHSHKQPFEALLAQCGAPVDRTSATFVQAVFEDARVMAYVVDADGTFVLVNATTSRLCGLPAAAFVGATYERVLPPTLSKEILRVNRLALEQSVPIVFRWFLTGTWFESVHRPLPVARGRSPMLLVTAAPALDWAGHEDPPGSVRVAVSDDDPLKQLSPREIEVLRLIGAGLTTAQIAERLFRTSKTIEAHRAALGRKLGVNNRVQLAVIAVRAGLLRIPLSLQPPQIDGDGGATHHRRIFNDADLNDTSTNEDAPNGDSANDGSQNGDSGNEGPGDDRRR
jgi:PAS domain S-box-containing protein